MALEFRQSGDLAYDKVFGPQSQPGADRRIVAGFEERFEPEAAEDAGELFPTPNAGGKILPRHRVADADKVRRPARGAAFGCGEDKVGRRTLECAKRRAVNRVDNDRDASAAGGKSA